MDPSPRRPTLLHICLQGRPRSSSALPAALTPARTTLTGRASSAQACRRAVFGTLLRTAEMQPQQALYSETHGFH